MNDILHSFSEAAAESGRFEMFVDGATPLQRYKPALDLVGLEQNGFFEAQEVRAFLSESNRKKTSHVLDSLGERDGASWILRRPDSHKIQSAWTKLLASEFVISFSRFESDAPIKSIVANLHLPVVHALPLDSLSGDWSSYIRRSSQNNPLDLTIALGHKMSKVCFVGESDRFSAAVEFASSRPPLMWGYSDEALKEIRRSRRLLIRQRA